MIDDDAEYEARRQISAQADADVAAFIESLGQDEGSGVPPPVSIRVTEVSTKRVKFSPFAFGQEDAGTTPSAQGSPPPPVPAACCLPDGSCEMLSSEDCLAAGGTFHAGQTCDDDPCAAPCSEITTIELSVAITGKMCDDSEPFGDYSTSKTFHRVIGSTGDDEFSFDGSCVLIGPNDNGGFGAPPARFEWNDGTLHPLFKITFMDVITLDSLERVSFCDRTISSTIAWDGSLGTFTLTFSGINGDGTPWSGTATVIFT